MKNVVINNVTFIGNNSDTKNAILSLFKLTGDDSIIKAASNQIGYESDDNSWQNIVVDGNIPFDIKLLTPNVVSFKTYEENPYDMLLLLNEFNPDTYMSVYFTDEEIGFNTGYYKLYQGEEIDYHSPKDNTTEAAELSLKVLDNVFYIFEYICDLEDEDLEDGINGSDEVLNTLLRHIYTKQILSDIYPIRLQEYLLELAIDEENYEFAAELKKVLDSAY